LGGGREDHRSANTNIQREIGAATHLRGEEKRRRALGRFTGDIIHSGQALTCPNHRDVKSFLATGKGQVVRVKQKEKTKKKRGGQW